ncbi:hypothetical protein GOP47_0008853 [Adiantum capillus-veneris]|uniref:Uncharacterized protein n=1 Tax=Adiantum capillus-veneris TaxID=13818 RepID=A0A9D4V025_ADICA|nr:hypothetical protein GOP47_0008853 [Adiantum capillus-veneris]
MLEVEVEAEAEDNFSLDLVSYWPSTSRNHCINLVPKHGPYQCRVNPCIEGEKEGFNCVLARHKSGNFVACGIGVGVWFFF